ncbi:protein of unknown function [Alteromonadaceae bacterium Bs31]|nr:protein of unknown function [Alteromonadaceae bacterium Bs31]
MLLGMKLFSSINVRVALLPFLLCFFSYSSLGYAEQANEEKKEQEKQNEEKQNDKEEDKDEEESINKITENSERIDGLFTLFRDNKNGELRMLIRKQQLDADFLYFTYVENGVAAAGWGRTRGTYNLQQAKLFRLVRHYNRIDFIEQNTRFYFDPNKPISRAAGANISPAVIFTQKIEAEDEANGDILIQANKLFLTEAFFPIKPLPIPDKKPQEVFSLGNLSEEKSKISSIRNYPENTDIIVEYVYQNDKPHVNGGPEVTDPRYVSIVSQHSILKAPEQAMEPRYDDARVGYFSHQITDLTSSEITPYRDVISRFKLEKKNPQAELSEPLTPITFWLENTTPEELRPIITKAALRWNEAFEQAGFKNALAIKIQPDDAPWDAGDLRYNVIRWVASPSRFYSGYGPSFRDPRTGQVLGADIMLEYAALGYQAQLGAVLGDKGSEDGHEHGQAPQQQCSASRYAHEQYLFNLAALKAFGAEKEEQQRLMEEFVYYLTIHEIGHTLGLNHNFHSTHMLSFEEVFNPDITYAKGMQGSIMDYPAVPFQADPKLKNQYYSTRPGPYDKWAVEFGYRPALADPAAEKQRQEQLLARSTEAQLAFANDADDMRSPGKGIDPRALIFDQSSDPIRFAQHQLSYIRQMQGKLRHTLSTENDSYQPLLVGYQLSLKQFQRHLEVVSRFIGGIYVDRALVGQKGAAETPFTPVAVEDQRRALAILSNELFSPFAFNSFDSNAAFLLEQRRGFNHFEYTLDPKLHETALSIQRLILDQLTHPRVVARLVDSAQYGNQFTLEELFVSLTDAIFKDDMKGEVNSYRQNLQLDFTQRLINIVKGKDHSSVAQSMALNRLHWVEKAMKKNLRGSLATKAHREHILYRINKALEN